MNITSLQDNDIHWADYVFISAMYIQKESVDKVLAKCVKLHTKVVAGGPLFTQEYSCYPQIEHFILNEAEITMPLFLNDLQKNNPLRLYQTEKYADMKSTPAPDFHLLSINEYASMNIQISRGCPFSCDFCEITSLLGHQVRIKTPRQVIQELEMLYSLNWRGPISIVDDNLIGNRKEVKNRILPAIAEWMRAHRYPFSFSAQTSINLADDRELLILMAEAGFTSTFIGIESPDERSLEECHKVQNRNRDMLQSVQRIQKAGLHVSAGFIVGFDSDSPSVFQRQVDFIQKSGIVSAMVGLLNAPKHTKLYNQMKAQDRLTFELNGNNTDMTTNFVPKMGLKNLQEGYHHIIYSIYSTKPYYKRVRKLILSYNRKIEHRSKISFSLFRAFLKSILIIGLLNKGRREYWKLVIWTLFNRPAAIYDAITYTVYGYHFRKVYGIQD
ncbi:B12-binding domain-containing radical SAM protein [Sunxiuqinia elliptica]|nr:B12-binding domain-containing radical SAM protein [Sunxiuqinia elliptica]